MDFNKLNNLKNNSAIRELAYDQTLMYEEFAKKCILIDWIKIYLTNKTFALWMYKWIPDRIWLEPFHLYLNITLNNNDKPYFRRFCENQTETQSLSINACSWNNLYDCLEKFLFLNKMKLLIDSDNIVEMNFKCLQSITISQNMKFNISNLNFIKNIKGLRNVELIRINISEELSNTLASINLKKLKFIEVSFLNNNQKMNLIDLFTKLKSFSMYNTWNGIIDNFLNSCDISPIEKVILHITSDKMFDLNKLRNFRSLKVIGFIIKIDSFSKYLTFKKATYIASAMTHCKFHFDFEVCIKWKPRCKNLRMLTYKTFSEKIVIDFMELKNANDNIFLKHLRPRPNLHWYKN